MTTTTTTTTIPRTMRKRRKLRTSLRSSRIKLWFSEGDFILVHAVYFSTLALDLGLDMLCVVKPVAFLYIIAELSLVS